jgi:xylulokinase
MWYRDTEPQMFSKVHKILGTKDYINYKLTGRMVTDYSYASGSGVYDLVGWRYSDEFIRASGLPAEIFPEIVPSTEIIGSLTGEAAEALELSPEVQVVCGGVDNSCMALGARNIRDGRVYTSMGSSSWIAVSSKTPVLDADNKPFVFTHVVPELFTSAVSIFAAGSSFRWLRDTVFADIAGTGTETGKDPYEVMTRLAETSLPGANRLLFNPSLAGGTSQEVNKEIRGAFAGLDLKHTRGDLVRSAMEGIALNLALVFEILKGFTSVEDTMLLVGGGSKSGLWRQIFADVFDMKMLKTNIDQDAGSLGAAAVAAVGTGVWDDFGRIDEVHSVLETAEPDPKHTAIYRDLRPAFQYLRETQAKLGEMLFSTASDE